MTDNFIPLGEALASMYATQQWTRQWRLLHLLQAWPEIVGNQVAALTTPAFFRREVLWIHVQDSAWMHHLHYVKLDLLERINAHLGEHPASDLRWLQQPFPAETALSARPAPRPIDPARERLFVEMSSAIPNLESRQALFRLWRTLTSQESPD